MWTTVVIIKMHLFWEEILAGGKIVSQKGWICSWKRRSHRAIRDGRTRPWIQRVVGVMDSVQQTSLENLLHWTVGFIGCEEVEGTECEFQVCSLLCHCDLRRVTQSLCASVFLFLEVNITHYLVLHFTGCSNSSACQCHNPTIFPLPNWDYHQMMKILTPSSLKNWMQPYIWSPTDENPHSPHILILEMRPKRRNYLSTQGKEFSQW